MTVTRYTRIRADHGQSIVYTYHLGAGLLFRLAVEYRPSRRRGPLKPIVPGPVALNLEHACAG
eukprot:5050054-Pleurochrysis_carterae.AAC.1